MLAVFLCLVAPGGVKLVQDIVVATTGVECCEDEDCQGSSTDDGCPKGGAHCASCSHGAAAVLPVVVAALELEFVAEDQKFQSAPDDVFSPGYRAPPFRPPTA